MASNEKQILDNVVFMYVKMQSPVKKYQSNDTEFTVDVVCSEDQAKAWKKLKTTSKPKSYDNDEFLETFKVDEVPFPDQDEQFVLKFKRAHTSKGQELDAKYRPRVFEQVGDEVVDITFEKLVANGSKGKVSYSTYENDFGVNVQLRGILVTELIEYEGGSGAPVGSEFGATKVAEAPKNQKPVEKQGEDAEKKISAKAGKAKAKPAPVEEPDDSDLPF